MASGKHDSTETCSTVVVRTGREGDAREREWEGEGGKIGQSGESGR